MRAACTPLLARLEDAPRPAVCEGRLNPKSPDFSTGLLRRIQVESSRRFATEAAMRPIVRLVRTLPHWILITSGPDNFRWRSRGRRALRANCLTAGARRGSSTRRVLHPELLPEHAHRGLPRRGNCSCIYDNCATWQHGEQRKYVPASCDLIADLAAGTCDRVRRRRASLHNGTP